MASPRLTLPRSADPSTRTSPALEARGKFSDVQLKPAPLRLTRKCRSDTQNCYTADVEPTRPPSPSPLPHPEIRHPKNPTEGELPAETPEPASSPSRKPAPKLVDIVTQYEILDTLSHVGTGEFSQPWSSRRHPRPFTPSHQTQNSPHETVSFTQGSPFRNPKLLTPKKRSSNTSPSDEDSPTAPTSPAHLRACLRPISRRESSPLKRYADTNTDKTDLSPGRFPGQSRQGKDKITED